MTFAARINAPITPDAPLLFPKEVLRTEGLGIAYGTRQAVHNISFSIKAGETVALVGESGSGKSTIAQALIGLLPASGRITSGHILLGGDDITRRSQRQLQALRGTRISLVPQDPGSSLNPVRTIGSQVAEMFHLHTDLAAAAVRTEVISLLERVGIRQPELRFSQYPHELSGGMRQRVLIAMAIALRPDLIIADEPTSALDVTVQKRILDLIDTLRHETGTAVLLITHDLGVAAQRADRMLVLQAGEIQDSGPARQVIDAPRSPYTQQLLADAPALAAPVVRQPVPEGSGNVIEVSGLRKIYASAKGSPVAAAEDISFSVARGTTHALVGESGSGKTTTARIIAGLLRPDAGTVSINGTATSSLAAEELRRFRRQIQLVYQNPLQSLDPRQTVRQIIEEPLLNFERPSRAERLRQVEELAGRVQLQPHLLDRRPAALSGGQQQRVAIARALILRPSILVLDEAVSALDVTVQARILTLLGNLQRGLGLTYLFVSHDLAVVRAISDTVSVFQAGRIVEQGTVAEVFSNPRQPYTRELIEAIPAVGKSGAERVAPFTARSIEGTVK